MDTAPIVTSILSEQGALVAFMLLVIAGLCWFAKYMLNELKEERTQSRQALVNNTSVLTELKVLINALSK